MTWLGVCPSAASKPSSAHTESPIAIRRRNPRKMFPPIALTIRFSVRFLAKSQPRAPFSRHTRCLSAQRRDLERLGGSVVLLARDGDELHFRWAAQRRHQRHLLDAFVPGEI